MRAELGEPAIASAEIALADDPVRASFEAATFAPVGPLDAQRLLELDDAASRLDSLRTLLAEEAAVLELRLSGA